MKADLHIHSHYSSDGEHSPVALIAIAKECGLDVVTISDHETASGVKEMLTAGKEAGITVIPGIELSGDINENIAHILGLGIDPNSKRFSNYLDKFEDIDKALTEELVRRFQKELNMDFDFDEMMQRCNEATWNLIPLVNELIQNPKYNKLEIVQPYLPGREKGDFPAGSFYWDYCTKGAPFYIRFDIASCRHIIEEIHNDGGLAILAHPFDMFYKNYEYLDQMKEAGLDGIEAFSNYHDAEMNLWYYDYCLANGLLVSGGSDFHGSYKPHVKMGEFGCDRQEEILAPLLQRLLSK